MGFRKHFLSIAAGAIALAQSLPTPAHAHGDEGKLLLTSVAYTVYVALLNPAGSALTATTVAGAVTATVAAASNAARKQMLVATLEDAAEYFETGKLTGILPEAIRQVRESSPEIARAADAEIVNAIVDAAYQSIGEDHLQ